MKALERRRKIWATHKREGSGQSQLSGLSVSWPVLSGLSHCLMFMLLWPLLGITSLCLHRPKLSAGFCQINRSSFVPQKAVGLNTLQPSVHPSCLFFILLHEQGWWPCEYCFMAIFSFLTPSSCYSIWRMGEMPEDWTQVNVSLPHTLQTRSRKIH